MDDFASRAYNKQCEKEYAECMTENDKGIMLDGKATMQKGATSYPTDGADRETACAGVNTEDEEIDVEKEYSNS